MYFSGWSIWLIQEMAAKSESMYLSSFSCPYPVRARAQVCSGAHVCISRHACVSICTPAYGGQRLTPLFSSREDFSLNLELTNLLGKLAPECWDLVSCHPRKAMTSALYSPGFLCALWKQTYA